MSNSKLLGGLYGALVGDALGVPVEFRPRAELNRHPVTDMRGYGSHNQPPGTWSDDGALHLCSMESLVEQGWNLEDMAQRFLRWEGHGHWAAHGRVFDIGIATSRALSRIALGTPAVEAGGRSETENGNGSLMRILPVALALQDEGPAELAARVNAASAITHGHARSQMACVFHALLARELLRAVPATAVAIARRLFLPLYADSAELEHFSLLLSDDLALTPERSIHSTGYVVHTLIASVWCLLTTQNFRSCVLKAVNLGDDTDTTGCVAGGLAGLAYGQDSIPAAWLAALPQQERLSTLMNRFVETYP
jgi:ADP-ribosyl-[dinitrogen reductase] hydrolase